MKKLTNTEAELKSIAYKKKACTSGLAKVSVFPFLINVFFRHKYVSRSFAITFEIISHKKVLLYDSCHVEPQKFAMIFSPKQTKKIIALKVFLQQSKISVRSCI